MSLCLVRLIKTVFRSIEYRETSFFKNWSWLFQKFSKLFSRSSIQTWLHLRFLSFFIILFARFLSPNTGKTLLPFFLFLFSHFMHFNLRISNLYNFGGFWWLRSYCLKLIIRFCSYDVFKMIFVGKFDQFGDLWKIKNSRACI